MNNRIQNNDNLYSEIRSLIDKWFDATISRSEEARLVTLLKHMEDCPEDIASERELLLRLKSLAINMPETIPDELDARIMSSLEAEIGKTKIPAGRKRFSFRAAFAVAASLAVIATIGLFAIRGLQNTHKGESELAMASLNIDNMVTQAENHGSLLDQSPKITEVIANNSISKTRNHRNVKKDISSEQLENHESEITEIDHSDYLSEAAESRLAEANYRIITDEDEADMIIFNIFAKYQGILISEATQFSKTDQKYGLEMSRRMLPEIENFDDNFNSD